MLAAPFRTRDLATKVVILTTFERDEYVFEALRSGASGFLLKNTPAEELIRAMQKLTPLGAKTGR